LARTPKAFKLTYDGRTYTLALNRRFTIRELRFIREFSGLVGGEVIHSMVQGDPTAWVAVLIVLMRREGIEAPVALYDQDGEPVEIEVDTEWNDDTPEVPAGPPAEPAADVAAP
jgi:hypothetical protein